MDCYNDCQFQSHILLWAGPPYHIVIIWRLLALHAATNFKKIISDSYAYDLQDTT